MKQNTKQRRIATGAFSATLNRMAYECEKLKSHSKVGLITHVYKKYGT